MSRLRELVEALQTGPKTERCLFFFPFFETWWTMCYLLSWCWYSEQRTAKDVIV